MEIDIVTNFQHWYNSTRREEKKIPKISQILNVKYGGNLVNNKNSSLYFIYNDNKLDELTSRVLSSASLRSEK